MESNARARSRLTRVLQMKRIYRVSCSLTLLKTNFNQCMLYRVVMIKQMLADFNLKDSLTQSRKIQRSLRGLLPHQNGTDRPG